MTGEITSTFRTPYTTNNQHRLGGVLKVITGCFLMLYISICFKSNTIQYNITKHPVCLQQTVLLLWLNKIWLCQTGLQTITNHNESCNWCGILDNNLFWQLEGTEKKIDKLKQGCVHRYKVQSEVVRTTYIVKDR